MPHLLAGDETHPLSLLIVGHNPSAEAWRQGHFYANPSNWMWRILRDTNLAPSHLIRGAIDDVKMPALMGIGFTDVGSGTPGTDSSQFKSQHFNQWRQPFYDRLQQHMQRVSKNMGCVCGRCGAPAIVAFSGKKQFQELFLGSRRSRNSGSGSKSGGGEEEKGEKQVCRFQEGRPGKIEVGRQLVLPSGWPLPVDGDHQVWVMSSTSGAAAMTREQRYRPWQALADAVVFLKEKESATMPPACVRALTS